MFDLVNILLKNTWVQISIILSSGVTMIYNTDRFEAALHKQNYSINVDKIISYVILAVNHLLKARVFIPSLTQ